MEATGLPEPALSSLIAAMSPASTRMGHVPVLDGFRALAIIIVMIAHAGAGNVIPGGFGVTIFFFLSGYLITSLMRAEAARSGSINLQDFYLRRCIRILPPFYITAALTALLTISGAIAAKLTSGSVLLDALFLTNYAQQFPKSFNHPLSMPLWSLDVEEHFYMILSTVFALFFVRWSPRRAAAACAIGCVVVLVIRTINVIAMSDYSVNYYWSHTRLDSILFGCCLALWQNPAMDEGAWRPKRLHVLAALFVLVVCIAIRSDVFRETVRYSLQGMALFVLFTAALQDVGVSRRILGSPVLRWIALISYTLYLIHMPVFAVLEHYHVPAAPLLGTVLSLLYATAVYWFVEAPLARWRRSLRTNKKNRPVVVSASAS
jgi:peptidoglycan/LPS O-acetylase OafA/YrhL